MDVTRDSYNLNLLERLMVLLRQILFNLAIAAIAEAILMQISAEQVPSLHGVVPRYLKLIFSNFWLFMLMSALMLFKVSVMTLLYSLLAFIPYALALSTSLLKVLMFTIAAVHKINVIGES